MSYMKHEEEYLPWLITMRNLEEMHEHLLTQPDFFELQASKITPWFVLKLQNEKL